MADRPIQVGDLVMIVGCNNRHMRIHLGKIGVALSACRVRHWDVEGATVADDGVPCSWDERHLKRLDPDALLDKTPTREEIEA